jgi:hypothetical protein
MAGHSSFTFVKVSSLEQQDEERKTFGNKE